MSKSKSPLVNQDEQKTTGAYQLTPDEQIQYARILARIERARTARETDYDYFDGQSYDRTYLANKRAAHSYLQPKKNDNEVRINTGTTEKRIELVWNELLSLNLEGEVRTFDKDDNLLQDVGEVFTDLVKRTEQIEQARDKDIFMFQELLTQPSVFVEELWIKERFADNSKKGFRTRGRCDRRLLQGPQIYLGDINMPDTRWNEQPYLIKYARMRYSEAEFIFKELNEKRWDYVHRGAYTTLGSPDSEIYRKGGLEKDEVEAFWYISWPDNEIQIVVNGVPFLELGTKYTDIFGNLGGYHITMVSLKPFGGDFAYGKPLTQSAKTLQALDNETIRNLIRKFRQALEPPVGVPRGKMWSRDIWNPGSINQGIKRNDFERLIDHQGITQSEMAMFDLIEKKTNEFIGTSQQEPLQGKTQVTATELKLAQQNAIRLLGLAVLAAMRLRERLVMLRVRNLLENTTKPTGQKFDPIEKKVKQVFSRFSLEGADIDGQQGTRVVQMMDRDLTPNEEQGIFDMEGESRKKGKPLKMKTMNVELLKNLDLYFYVSVNAKPRESNDLDKAMMTEMITQGSAISQITGRQMDSNKIINRFERVYGERGLFQKDVAGMEQQLGMMQLQRTPGIEQFGRVTPQRPSVNTLQEQLPRQVTA